MVNFNKIKSLKGIIEVPADKSITHRAIFFASMAKGLTTIYNPLISDDTIATLEIMQKLGVDIKNEKGNIVANSKGYNFFIEPENVLDCKNSGTTARLLLGLLAPQRKYFVMTGDDSLRKRPIDRVITPLCRLNAKIFARMNNRLLPATITHSEMCGGVIEQIVASAQVKSAIILAAIQLNDEVNYIEKSKTRNHTELIAPAFGVDIKCKNNTITVKGGSPLKPYNIIIPGDFSSAAFYIAAALIFENSSITIKNVGLNDTRTAFLEVLKNMGAKISIELKEYDIEPFGDIFVEYGKLKGIKITEKIIPNIIDELPLLALLGLFSEDTVEVRGAKELRIKESDRIKSLAYNIKALGAKFEEFEDGFIVYPLDKKKISLKKSLKSFSDHRVAMINILLAKKFGEDMNIDDISSISVSNPEFLSILKELEEV